MHTNAINTFWATELTAPTSELVLPTVTPTIAMMNSQIHIPMAPMMRRRRRPTRSMSWTPTIVITVLTKSAMILGGKRRKKKKKRKVFRRNFQCQRKKKVYRLDDESVGDPSLLEEGLDVRCLTIDNLCMTLTWWMNLRLRNRLITKKDQHRSIRKTFCSGKKKKTHKWNWYPSIVATKNPR